MTTADLLRSVTDTVLDVARVARRAPLGLADAPAGWFFTIATDPGGAPIAPLPIHGGRLWLHAHILSLGFRPAAGPARWVFRLAVRVTATGRLAHAVWYRWHPPAPVPPDAVWATLVGLVPPLPDPGCCPPEL